MRDVWRQEEVPKAMALGEMIPIFKNKGSSNDFSKYRMIGLIGHAMKLVSSVLLYYLLRETTDFLPESQSGFRKGRSTRDAIYILAKLLDHCLATDPTSGGSPDSCTSSSGDPGGSMQQSEPQVSGDPPLRRSSRNKLHLKTRSPCGSESPGIFQHSHNATSERTEPGDKKSSQTGIRTSPENSNCGPRGSQEPVGTTFRLGTNAETGVKPPEAKGYGGEPAGSSTRAVITYIDFVAAFDSVSHRFLDESMEEAKCRFKTRAIFRAIYRSATAQVRVQPPGGGDPIKTKPFDVNRGVVQGDIFSPVCFIVALECLMRKADAGGGITMLQVFISKLEYADDAALINRSCKEASERVSRLARKARELADMEISIPKTEAMLVRKDVRKDKIEAEEFSDMDFKQVCEWCGMSYPTKDGLRTHITVHCKVKKGTYEEEFEVEKVLDVRGRPDERFYLVRWKGDWKKDKETWQNWRDVTHAQEEVDAFWELQEESVDGWREDKAAWIPGEVRCKTCCKDRTAAGTLFKSEKSIRDHHKCKWVKPSRTGTCAERAVHRKRKKEAHDRAGTVTCEGEALKKAFDFTYLGFGASTDGDNLTPMNARLQLASSRYSGMGNIWKSSEISLTLKLRIYQAAVCSVVMYGSEAWIWNEALEKKLKNWNAKRVAFMTEKEIREEYKDPTFDLVARTRKRRLDWAKDLLQADSELPSRQIMIASVQAEGWGRGLLMDAAVKDLEEITAMARDSVKWNEQHSKVGPRDMLTSLKRERDRGTVLDAEAEEWLCGASALDGQFKG